MGKHPAEQLGEAARTGDVDAVRKLLAKKLVLPDTPDPVLKTQPILQAATWGHAAVRASSNGVYC